MGAPGFEGDGSPPLERLVVGIDRVCWVGQSSRLWPSTLNMTIRFRSSEMHGQGARRPPQGVECKLCFCVPRWAEDVSEAVPCNRTLHADCFVPTLAAECDAGRVLRGVSDSGGYGLFLSSDSCLGRSRSHRHQNSRDWHVDRGVQKVKSLSMTGQTLKGTTIQAPFCVISHSCLSLLGMVYGYMLQLFRVGPSAGIRLRTVEVQPSQQEAGRQTHASRGVYR